MAANAQTLAQVKADALRQAADEIEADMGPVWGGDSMWLTTGTKVATLTAEVLRSMAEDVA